MRGGGTYGVDNEVIQEPRGRNGKEPDPVSLNDQPVRDLGVLHGIALEPLGFIHPQPPQEDGEGGNDTEPKGEAPDSPKVVGSEATIRGLGQTTRSREVVGGTNIQ